MIELEAVTVRAGKRTLLDNVSLRVAQGEVLAIVGPNGAGKTTLLRTLTGEAPTAAGEVRLGGRGLHAWGARELARVRAVLPQESSLGFPFTAHEVALMGRTPHVESAERPADHAIARAALALAQVGHLGDRSYTTLSGGERQRVHLARVLAQLWDGPREQGRYLLLDEPTSSLDITHQHLALRAARQVARDGAAVIAVLHDLNLAAQYADRLLLLRAGAVVATGTPTEVLIPSLIREAFCFEALVTPHPHLPIPVVIAGPQGLPFPPKESNS